MLAQNALRWELRRKQAPEGEAVRFIGYEDLPRSTTVKFARHEVEAMLKRIDEEDG